MKKTLFLLCPGLLAAALCCLALAPLAAQEGEGPGGDAPPAPPEAEAAETLPRQFRALSLGMELEELKAELQKDGLFSFRGDQDVSFLPLREQTLVETGGISFISRAFFQLREGRVFIMAFTLNPGLIDHYSVFTSFVKKYGEPGKLDPGQAVWEGEETRVSIERPLTVKYIDMKVFSEIAAESRAKKAEELFLREEFLSDF